MTLGHVVQFTTGTDEEPVLGFKIHPAIEFCENTSFLPSANTCSNSLKLVRGSLSTPLPSEAQVFDAYDLPFVMRFFGVL